MWGKWPHYLVGATWHGPNGTHGECAEPWRVQLFPLCSDDGLDLDEDQAFWVNFSEVDPRVVDPNPNLGI